MITYAAMPPPWAPAAARAVHASAARSALPEAVPWSPAPWRPRDVAKQVEARMAEREGRPGGCAVAEDGKSTYCFRAVSRVEPVDSAGGSAAGGGKGCPLSDVTGYDTSPEIARAVEAACGARLRALGARGHGFACGTAELAMLPAAPKGCECTGQLFYTLSGKTRKLV